MEDITDADYNLSKTVCKDFEIKIVGQYHNFCVQSNKLLLADLFENFIYLKTYDLKYMSLILQNFFQLLDQYGKQL